MCFSSCAYYKQYYYIYSQPVFQLLSSILFLKNQPYPRLKKCTMDKDQPCNYHPIANLSLISKIIECVVRSRLTDLLSSNNLLNPRHSAYCKHHSTETALLYIHDQLIVVIGSQKICLSLLDFSAAFDTIDHCILITRLFLIWVLRVCIKLV